MILVLQLSDSERQHTTGQRKGKIYTDVGLSTCSQSESIPISHSSLSLQLEDDQILYVDVKHQPADPKLDIAVHNEPGIGSYYFSPCLSQSCYGKKIPSEKHATHSLLFRPILFCRITCFLLSFFSKHAKKFHDFIVNTIL